LFSWQNKFLHQASINKKVRQKHHNQTIAPPPTSRTKGYASIKSKAALRYPQITPMSADFENGRV